MDRRAFMLGTAAVPFCVGIAAAEEGFLIQRTDAEWRSMLTNIEYSIMRQQGTERKRSSPLLTETREGIYHCKGCNLQLYSSETKYESRSGWPSFYQSLPNAIGTRPDSTWFTRREEAHCRRCGSHLGHIFNDGPQPTGKRHSLNGVSLLFVPATEADMHLKGDGRRRVLRA